MGDLLQNVSFEHLLELGLVAALNVWATIRVLNAQFSALSKRVDEIDDRVTDAHKRVDVLLLNKR